MWRKRERSKNRLWVEKNVLAKLMNFTFTVESCTLIIKSWLFIKLYFLLFPIFIQISLEFSSTFLFCPFYSRCLCFSSKSYSFQKIQVLNWILDLTGKKGNTITISGIEKVDFTSSFCETCNTFSILNFVSVLSYLFNLEVF